jgi:hypothetical protein
LQAVFPGQTHQNASLLSTSGSFCQGYGVFPLYGVRRCAALSTGLAGLHFPMTSEKTGLVQSGPKRRTAAHSIQREQIIWVREKNQKVTKDKYLDAFALEIKVYE